MSNPCPTQSPIETQNPIETVYYIESLQHYIQHDVKCFINKYEAHNVNPWYKMKLNNTG